MVEIDEFGNAVACVDGGEEAAAEDDEGTAASEGVE